MNDTTVSSNDVINAYQEKVSELIHENALLRAQVTKLLRERTQTSPDGYSARDGQAALQAGTYPKEASHATV